jgi:hypothetical protein
LTGDPGPINPWDLGLADGNGLLSPTNSILQVTTGTNPSPTNLVGADPKVISPFDVSISALPWRGDPHFVGTVTIVADLPASRIGNYGLLSTSPAINAGASSKNGVNAPLFDVFNIPRPSFGGFEIGAAEIPGPVFLDDFNRANGGVGSNWQGNTATGFYAVNANTLKVNNSGYLYWKTVFGANQEAIFTFNKLGPAVTDSDLLLKGDGGDPLAANAHLMEIHYDNTTHKVTVETLAPGQGWKVRATFSGISFGPGDTFWARTYADGSVLVYKNGAQIGSTNVTTGPTPWPSQYVTGGGRIGVWFIGPNFFQAANDTRIDNFGGGTIVK